MKRTISIAAGSLVTIVALSGWNLGAVPENGPTENKAVGTSWVRRGSIDGWCYDQQKLDPKVLEGMQRWNPVAEECPLAPGKAIQLALKQMKSAFSVPDSMKVSSIVAQPHPDRKDVWYYTIVFAEGAFDVESGYKGSWIIVDVFLDGTVPAFRRGERDPNVKKAE